MSVKTVDLGNVRGPMGEIPTAVTAGTGAAYTVTVEGIAELKTGLMLVVIPHTDSETGVSLNVNALGAKPVSPLKNGKPMLVMYDGETWNGQDYDAVWDKLAEVKNDAFNAKSTADAALRTAEEAISGSTAVELGTAEHPYQISTAAALYDILHNHPDKHAVLVCDIDCGGLADWAPVGTTAAPYTGTLDGQGFTIRRLRSAYAVNNVYYTGFISVNGGTVKNVRFSAANMTGDYVGVVAGLNRGVIKCVAVADGTVTAGVDGGGITARNEGTITDCYSRANVTAQNAAGIATYNTNSGSITNVYNAGTVRVTEGASGRAAGIAISNAGSASLSGACCLLPDTTVFTKNNNIAGCETVAQGDLLDQSTIQSGAGAEWDFETVWEMPEAGMYPALRVMHSRDAAPEKRPDGSAEEPYLITDETDLNNIRNDLNGHYVLTGDITVSRGFIPIGSVDDPFTGTLDGRQYQISNMTINTGAAGSDGNVYAGLFVANSGTIKDLTLAAPSINVSAANAYIGTVAVVNNAGGTIERTGVYIGTVQSGNVAGGLTAINHGTIKDVYSRVTISSATKAAGIAVVNDGSITTALNIGSLPSDVSGNIAYTNNGTITSCYGKYGTPIVKDEESTGTQTSSALKWDSALKQQSTYDSEWDFETVWVMDTYPTFRKPEAEVGEIEALQQEITTLELNDIEQGQQITDLELMILGGAENA